MRSSSAEAMVGGDLYMPAVALFVGGLQPFLNYAQCQR